MSMTQAETISMPRSLDDWKSFFRAQIDKARCADMREADRDELVRFLKLEVEEIFDIPF